MCRAAALLLGLGLLGIPARANACPWDSDTGMLRRATVPELPDLIAGRFARHSDAFHQWRAADSRNALLDSPDDLLRLDDLAVSLDRLGRHDEAIAVMHDALLVAPDRYETHANLATFHQHRGDLPAALHHVRRALEHGPRRGGACEAMQEKLLEFALARDTAGPVVHEGAIASGLPLGFATVVSMAPTDALGTLSRMALRGEHDWPLLLEAIGDLQPVAPRELGAARLRAMAYVRAADLTDTPALARAYRTAAERTMKTFAHQDLATVQYELHWEVADGAARNEQIADQELGWLDDPSATPRAAFADAYYPAPGSVPAEEPPPNPEPKPGRNWTWLLWLPLGGAVLTVVLGRAHAMA